MQPLPPVGPDSNEAGVFQYGQVLGSSLPGDRQPPAQGSETLIALLTERVEELASMGVGDRTENTGAHRSTVMQPYGCMSSMFGRIVGTPVGHRLEFTRDLPASVDRVWQMLTDPAERATWLIGGVLEPRVNGVVDLVDDHHHVTGRVTQCDPPHVLALTWSSTDAPLGEVRFELTALTDDTCRLRLVHSAGPGARVQSLGAGWHALLGRLGALLGATQSGSLTFADLLLAYEDVPIEQDRV